MEACPVPDNPLPVVNRILQVSPIADGQHDLAGLILPDTTVQGSSAEAAGLEPTTCGFGDRRSTS
jgi:hypothetical protein